MKIHVSLFIALVSATASLADYQTYPGTLTRPILSEDEARIYTQDIAFLGWSPRIDFPTKPDYIVNAGESIQAVVNQALFLGNPVYRKYIRIEPGTYMETVYVTGSALLTLYGGGDTPDDVHIIGSASATMTPAQYRTIVNPGGNHYKPTDPAWSLYEACSYYKTDIIGLECTAVVWAGSTGFELYGVTVHNNATDAPGLAIRTSSSHIYLTNCNFLGGQQTLGLGIGIHDDDYDIQQYVLVKTCYIEGEKDYIVGSAVAVFNMVTFNTVTSNDSDDQVIFAPNTIPGSSYGFLVINSTITGDPTYSGSNKVVKLGRSWDRWIASEGEYVPGKSRNGVLIIRETQIDNIINIEEPYASALSSDRPFSTQINSDRNLNDNRYNRLWEYNNRGSGS